jgi:Leucine-rich repeat (LRR) protein
VDDGGPKVEELDWMARPTIEMWALLLSPHGLILEMSINGKQELEDVGDLYIEEFISRSFFQDAEKYPFFYTFKMHDLIHDLAISVAQGECSVVDLGNKDITRTVHHLSFSAEDLGQEVPKCLDKLTKVRTVRFPTKQPLSLVEACISRFKYLRLLDLCGSSFEVLPNSFGTLMHLRYLDLSGNQRIKELPNSICKLYNLQALLLGGCRELERLPKDMRNMTSLRSLVITTKSTYLLENGSFNSLRLLFLQDCMRLEVLFQGMDGCITNLRELVIDGCTSLTSLPLNIKHLTFLEVLVIAECEELVLMGENIQDLKLNLRTLVIQVLPKLEVLPQWIQGSANTLQYLTIEECENFTALPEWLSTLKSLCTLKIINCPKLSSLPKKTHCLTASRSLKIKGCHELSRKCKQEDQHKIAHVPEVELDDLDLFNRRRC